MYLIKIGEDRIRVCDKEDAKTLTIKLIDMGCTERVTSKYVENGDTEGEEDD